MVPDLTAPPGRWAALLCLTLCACGLPRDADGTTDRVRGGVIRVGVIENPPWASRDGGGVEGALVQELARRLRAKPLWVPGPEAKLMTALHSRELDLVIGGLTADSPWQKQVALTRPLYTDTIAVAPANASPHPLQGAQVGIEPGDPIAAELRKEGATPVFVRGELGAYVGPIAAPTWKLAALERAPVGRTLKESAHVLAAPPGENRWLVEIEQLLHEREPGMPMLLRKVGR